MARKNALEWQFGKKLFIRIEVFFVSLISALVFLLALLQQENNIGRAFLFMILFIALYGVIAFVIARLRKVEERYILNKTHLEVHRSEGGTLKKEKLALKDVSHHKIDRVFLGGYVQSNKGMRHHVYFNTPQEADSFVKHLDKHAGPKKSSPKKRKTAKKR